MLKYYFLGVATTIAMVACGTYKSNNAAVDTTSASEIATAVVAGSVNATNPSGSQASRWEHRAPKSFWASLPDMFTLFDKAFASTACPTVQSGGPGCSSTANSETLTYSNCSFTGSLAVWNGSQTLTESGGSTLGCTTPAFAVSSVLQRVFGAGTTRTSAGGITVTLDTTGDTTGWSTPVAATGINANFTGVGGARTITIAGVHTTGTFEGAEVFDHTIYTTTSLSVAASGAVTSGTVIVEHNLAKYVATANFTNVGFTAGCCYPVSGSVSTTITGGGTQTLAFSSTCGEATLNGAALTLTQCF